MSPIRHRATAPGEGDVAGSAGSDEWNADHKHPAFAILLAADIWANTIPSFTADTPWPQYSADDMLPWPGSKFLFADVAQVRLICNVEIAASAGTYFDARAFYYKASITSFVTETIGTGGNSPRVTINTVGLKDSGWVNVNTDLKAFDPDDVMEWANKMPRVGYYVGGGNDVTMFRVSSAYLYAR
jgi:hypothetical protein